MRVASLTRAARPPTPRRLCAAATSLHALAAEVFDGAAPPRVLLLLGGPGAGKGAAAAALRADGWRTVSAGALLRAAARRDAAVAAVIGAGGVVPGAVSAAAVLRWMRARGGDRWVVDGFPRNVEGAEVWEAADGAVWGALELRVGRAELARRLAARGRADDGAPVVARRLAGHDRDMPALRRFYRERGVYGAVDGVGDVHAVADRVRQWVDGRAARGPAAG